MEARERLANYGAGALSEDDLVEVVLGRKASKGPTRIQQLKLKAAIELGRRKILGDTPPPRTVSSPDDLHDIVVARLGGLATEEFHVVALNARNAVIDIVRVAAGTADACSLHPRDVFRAALARNATAIILVHNHPSGNPNPSSEDLALTERVKEGVRVLGLRLLDHLVVAGKTVTSLRSIGLW